MDSLLVAHILPPWSSIIFSQLTILFRCLRLQNFSKRPPGRNDQNVWQIRCCNTPAIILNLHLDKIANILDTDVDKPSLLVQIFNGISNNIVNHSAKLFRIRNDLCRSIRIIKVCQSDIFDSRSSPISSMQSLKYSPTFILAKLYGIRFVSIFA